MSLSPGTATTASNALKQRVQARDRLVQAAESAGQDLQQLLLAALTQGDLAAARSAAAAQDRQLRELAENLRIYQFELHAQADELVAAQARNEQLLSRFATLFGGLPVAALLLGFNGEVVESNGRARQLLALRPAGSGLRFLHRMVDQKAYQEHVRPAIHEAFDTGASALDSVPLLAEDGRRFVGELHIARLPGPGQELSCVIIDRSEQLQTLQALRQSEAFLASSARLARTGGWELQLRPRQLRWSAELLGLFGLHQGHPLAMDSLDTLLGLCSPYDRGLLARAVAGAEAGQAFEIELDMHTNDGQPLRMLAAGYACQENGEIDRVSGVFQDISLQAEARRRIDDLTERLHQAHDAGGIGIWDWDLAAGTMLLDERLRQLLGLQPDSAPPGTDLVAVLGAHLQADDARLLAQAVARTLEQRVPLNQELRRRDETDAQSPPGRRFLHITGRAHFDAEGRATRLVGCAWDSSPEHEAARLRAAKDAAESASRAKSDFLSRMSHELRTPLNAILGFSQLMRLEAEGGDLQLKPHRVALIESAARHLLDLVNEVLDVSRIESGQMQVRMTAVPLQPLLGEVLGLLEGQAAQAAVQLHDHTARALRPHGLVVQADRLRLKEVLINVISNAIKYNLPGGQVQIDAATTDGELVLTVLDTGRGLDKQQMTGLFQPFNRLGAEASGIEGTGMGLFVSQRFMELMGGRIVVSSRPGVGTMVQLLLKQAA